MADHVTTRFGFTGLDPSPSALEYVNNWPSTLNALLDSIDAKLTGYSTGVIASRPAAGTAGRVYLATDDRTSSPNGTLYFDNGTAWVLVTTNNYAAGVIASRPRTGTRGQLYYATDDTTAGANGTLYLFDGTGWNQVQTGAGSQPRWTLAERSLLLPASTPTGTYLAVKGSPTGTTSFSASAGFLHTFRVAADDGSAGRTLMLRLVGSACATGTANYVPSVLGGAMTVDLCSVSATGSDGSISRSTVLASNQPSDMTITGVYGFVGTEVTLPLNAAYAIRANLTQALPSGTSVELSVRAEARLA